MQVVAAMASKVSGVTTAIDRSGFTDQCGFMCTFSKPNRLTEANNLRQYFEFRKISSGRVPGLQTYSSNKNLWHVCGIPYHIMIFRRNGILCRSTGTSSSETKECAWRSKECTDSSSQTEEGQPVGTSHHLSDHQSRCRIASYAHPGLAEACRFVYNDAKFVNERARNDIILLSRGITRLNDRARQDVAVLGLEFLKLDARAREDTEKIDHGVKKKAARLHHIATTLKDKAHSKLKTVADKHWSDGALEADLRRANFCMRRRAMEDAFMALKFVRDIHEMMANKLYQQPRRQGSLSENDVLGFITLEKNGKSLDLFSQEVPTDRITAIQEAYWSMASALSEADGIDYTDPEELELLVTTLIDLDAMDGKSSVSLLAECSSSPDVSTRQALANALAAAPSMWILGNAGMGALQRLAQDSNHAVAAAASKAIDQLKQQWELEEGDSLRFMMNRYPQEDDQDETDTEMC
ncbi:Armadillo-like helical-containing protein [Dioscorea alata]|uniref:Armadillo-like helical-containing protein n=1 Tax=Dioscorea alata TaxID=55571 RepID=A0ACB7W515_DIOAL|nr:Armadillo-like helical-containing protein [Dioscorea alata]